MKSAQEDDKEREKNQDKEKFSGFTNEQLEFASMAELEAWHSMVRAQMEKRTLEKHEILNKK